MGNVLGVRRSGARYSHRTTKIKEVLQTKVGAFAIHIVKMGYQQNAPPLRNTTPVSRDPWPICHYLADKKHDYQMKEHKKLCRIPEKIKLL